MNHAPVHPLPGTVPATTTSDSVRGNARGGLALIVRTIAGAVLLLVGAAMLVLPGPGLLVIVAGLSLLAVDYVWARRLRTHATERLAATGRTIRSVTIGRRPRHDPDPDAQANGPAHTDHQRVRNRDPRPGAEHPPTEVRW